MKNDVVTLQLDKVRELKYRRKELKMLEKSLKVKISNIDFDNIGVDDLTMILHAGLQYSDPDLTLTQVENLLDEAENYTFGELIKTAMQAFAIAMGGSREDAEDDAETETEETDAYKTLDGKN